MGTILWRIERIYTNLQKILTREPREVSASDFDETEKC